MQGNHYNTREMAVKALKRRQNHQVVHTLRGVRVYSPRRGERKDQERPQRGGSIEVGLKECSWIRSHRESWAEGKKHQPSPEMEKYRTRKSESFTQLAVLHAQTEP